MVRSDYSEKFATQLESQRFQIARDQQCWEERFVPPTEKHEVVLNFGCGVQFTPHLMVETVSVLSKLEVDFVAVAGPQWCCGQPYIDGGDPGSGRNMTSNSARRMAAFEPIETVHWCGAWWPQLGVAFPERPPFGLTHITEFLTRTLVARATELRWATELDAEILLHLKSRDPMPLTDRGSPMAAIEAAVPAALAVIPGVRIAGHTPVPSRGLPCRLGPGRRSAFDTLLADEVREVQDELAAAADAVGANVIVTAHQACHREWGKFTSERLPIRHFISLLAEALGVGEPDRYHAYWQLGDREAIVERARASWESWGMNRDKAEEIAAKLFLPR